MNADFGLFYSNTFVFDRSTCYGGAVLVAVLPARYQANFFVLTLVWNMVFKNFLLRVCNLQPNASFNVKYVCHL